jgi:acetyl-CoA acyltransferase
MEQAVIVGYGRSPFQLAHKGDFVKVRPDELASTVIKSLTKQQAIKLADIEDLLCGCAFPEAEQGLNLGRMLVFLSDLPDCVAGATINRWCGSSMQAVHMAAASISTNAGELFIIVGVESMSRIPMMGFNPLPNTALHDEKPNCLMSMGMTAEKVARKFNISREMQEAYALQSQQKAHFAQQNGMFMDEIIPIGQTTHDGCIRADANIEQMSQLSPAFDQSGTVTAATSSPLTDGASALLVCSQRYAKQNNLKPMAKIISTAVAGCDPQFMGMGPVHATQKALKRAGLSLSDIDIFELNEAFAAQAIACIQQLAIPFEKVNLDGGAIAIGHPLGASGARITGKLASLLQREGKRYGVATQCIGGGQGIATILEAV